MERMAEDHGRPLVCSHTVIETTLSVLQHYGKDCTEGVVLWLGRPQGSRIAIAECYHPIQEVESHSFHIPRDGMDQLRDRLRADRLMVAAQVHTHPEEAFHSEADDRWAIVRHQGALSLVLPYFALETTPALFLNHCAIFALSPENEWQLVPPDEVSTWLTID
jgi:proteasome lid subunit RPN8/RPN11